MERRKKFQNENLYFKIIDLMTDTIIPFAKFSNDSLLQARSMRHLLKIASAITLFGILLFFVSKKSNSEKEVIIKVKASKTASYSNNCFATYDNLV
ncbi:MAG: hypothetical protein IPP89_15715 [Saprospiraceae bacterium]|nr:hypothetical protein [Candidatus Brachybacter algidus]MBL0120385.1 hypothetical protein [Candidatus Brachybacter algidus]